MRVPNERPNADTTKVTVRLPEGLFFVSFEVKPGWKRTIRMEKLSEPVEFFGEEVEERVAEVSWEGGKIAPGEFDEFGISFRVPENGERLLLPALQTYSNGEVARWIAPDPEADTPAPAVEVVPAADEQAGSAAEPTTTEESTEAVEAAGAAAPETGSDDGDGRATAALVLGIGALVLGALALRVALLRRPGGA